jgi:uncharacterized membrane protein YkoI
MTRWTLIVAVGLFSLPPAFARAIQPASAAEFEPPSLVATQQADEREREPGPADLEEAIEIALKRYPGEAAGAETVVREGQRVHEVRVFGQDGTVRTVRVDPETGAIIPQQR